MMRLALVFALLATPVLASDQPPKSPDELECKTGPVIKTYGGTPWLAYACNDGHSLSLVSAPGSKAMPFVFMFHWDAGQYQLSGVGTGNKAATDAAFRDIGAFTGRDILALLSEAQTAAHHP
jgi:hypothetical protein